MIDHHSCRSCFEEEESSFHVIAECPALQSYRSEAFKLSIPTTLPNPPEWTVTQVKTFLRISPIGEMLDQTNGLKCKIIGPSGQSDGSVWAGLFLFFFPHLYIPPHHHQRVEEY